jgi:hypothetical protein
MVTSGFFDVRFESKMEYVNYGEHFNEMVTRYHWWGSHAETIMGDQNNNAELHCLGQEVMAKYYNLINLFECDHVDLEVHRRMVTFEELFADFIELHIFELESGDGPGVGPRLGAGVDLGDRPGLV